MEERDHATPNQSASVLRRRSLLRGLGATAAAAGAGLPLSARAGINGYTGKYCVHPTHGKNCFATISGNQSVVASLAPGNSNDCKGHNCAHYCATTNWPSGCDNGYGVGYTCNTKFWVAFGCSQGSQGSNKNKTLLELCSNAATSEEAHFACALVNAKKRTIFPYTQKEVVDLYNNSSKKAAALAFFSGFMETLS